MPKYAAFLRAINVGRRRVKMDHLRRLFQEIGLAEVETFLASGNVVFEAASTEDLETRISQALHAALGYEVVTFCRSMGEIAQIARYRPFPRSALDTPGSTLYIGFIASVPSDHAQQELLSWSTETDQFHVNERQVYWLCHTRVSESAFSGAQFEKTLGMPATMRNSRTVARIAAKYASPTPTY